MLSERYIVVIKLDWSLYFGHSNQD